MRTLTLILAVGVLGLSACASATNNPGPSDVQRLAEDCRARGGVLTPTGAATGRAETENVCRISGSGSRIERTPGS